MQQQEYTWSEGQKDSTISQRLAEQNNLNLLLAAKAVKVLPLVTP